MLDSSEMVSMKMTYASEDYPEEDKSNSSSSSSSNEVQTETKKTCADCGTTKTPLWRGGPAGPKSLCNACGIKSRKRRRAVVAGAGSEEKKVKKGAGNHNRNPKIGESLKKRLLQLGRDAMMMQGSSRKLGEEEQAAILLMALSYGSVYA